MYELPIYNKYLVRRGEALLGFDLINNWDSYLKEISKDKISKQPIIIQTLFSSLGPCRHIFI
ncbi:MAG TPA: hypothetical protein VIY08_07955 [Candidatus Nitrosocosmicus sp.]